MAVSRSPAISGANGSVASVQVNEVRSAETLALVAKSFNDFAPTAFLLAFARCSAAIELPQDAKFRGNIEFASQWRIRQVRSK